MAQTDFEFVLDGRIVWRIAANDPDECILKCMNGVEIVNPRLYFAYAAGSYDMRKVADGPLRTGNQIMLKLDTVVLRCQSSSLEELTGHQSTLDRFVRTLRVLSGQDHMPNGFAFSAVLSHVRGEQWNVPFPKFPKTKPRKVFVNTNHWARAVQWKHVELADKWVFEGKDPPVFDLLITDAVAADRQHDWTRAILYSAMAMDAFVSTFLDGKMAEFQSRAKQPKHLNFRKFAVSKNETVVNDPVYDQLAKGTDFGKLLDTVSRYVLRRSMLEEKKSLFDSAKKVYQTRNKIVHKGGPASDETKTLTIDAAGSKSAIQTAFEVAEWYGAETRQLQTKQGFTPMWGTTYNEQAGTSKTPVS